MPNKYIRTFGYVLRRTNYKEADRILNIITPSGKFSVIAKGVRREKSKLAGGVEMFSLIDFNIYQGQSKFGVVTGARMVEYYGKILEDYSLLEVAAWFLKKINSASDNSDSDEYFNILGQSLAALNSKSDLRLVQAWFLLNLVRANGEDINLYRDINGKKLEVLGRYEFDNSELAFSLQDNGEFSANEIKMLRLMVTSDFDVIKRVKVSEDVISKILHFALIISGV